jgi:hypothetical protein
MDYIGRYCGREVYWLDFNNYENELPDKDWLCLAISSIELDEEVFTKFVRRSIENDILEFKGAGNWGEKLHDLFDETMIEMENENNREIDISTTCHNDQVLADAFWQCFYATGLPATADYDNIKVICTDLDGINRIAELKSYLKEFELGWLP